MQREILYEWRTIIFVLFVVVVVSYYTTNDWRKTLNDDIDDDVFDR